MSTGSVSRLLQRSNGAYYDHIFTYTVNADGSYNIVAHKVNSNPVDYENVSISNGVITINGKTNTVVANNDTVFLVKGEDEYTYETYVGKSNVPAGKGDICVLTNNVGYATLVVLTDYELSNNNFFAYVADGNAETGLTAQGYGYDVYKVGSVEATRLWDDNNTFSAAYTGTGLYEFTVDNDNNIVSANKRMTDLYATSGTAANSNTDSIWKKDDLTFNRAQVAAAEAAGSIQFETYTNLVAANNDNGYTTTSGKAWKDFAVDKDTIVINVNKTALTAPLRCPLAISMISKRAR